MQLWVYGVLVFLAAWIAGWVAIRSFRISHQSLNFFLTFSGAYLFSITIVHILPELFASSDNATYAGLYVLGGFFLQQVLEFFTAGVEHGHMHKHPHKERGRLFLWNVVVALFVHAFLEGTLLTDTHGDSIFMGIFIHKAPAAFALVSVILAHGAGKARLYLMLLVFSLASPLGMTFSHIISSQEWQYVLFGVVAGSFLQISTTIVFESSSDHRFNLTKLLFSLSGAVFAILSELFFL